MAFDVRETRARIGSGNGPPNAEGAKVAQRAQKEIQKLEVFSATSAKPLSRLCVQMSVFIAHRFQLD